MNLKYISFFQVKVKNKISIHRIFSKKERYSFWVLKLCARSKNVEFNAIYENEELIGMEYILKHENTIYLFYLAVNNQYKGRGYGSQVLKDLIKRYKEKVIILCTEKPDRNCKDIKSRRKEFYIKNNFYSTDTIIKYMGVEFEVLCTSNNFVIKEKLLKNLYKQMTISILGGPLIDKIFSISDVIELKQNL